MIRLYSKEMAMFLSLLLLTLLSLASVACGASHCMTNCGDSLQQRELPLYLQVCCQVDNLGRTVRLHDGARTKIFFCPSIQPQSCNTNCQRWFESGYTDSGDYNIYPHQRTSIKVYCDMEGTQCDGRGGWTRVGYLNMTQSDATCPPGLSVLQFNNIDHDLCGRPLNTSEGGCSSTTFSSLGLSYTAVCGQVRGYAYHTPDAFNELRVGIGSYYVKGVSITHGCNPRQHIWTYAAGLREDITDHNGCPCSTGYNGDRDPTSTFVGSHYYCESALDPGIQWAPVLYVNDTLWDGMQCDGSEAPCCANSTMPWFHRQFNEPTQDDIELRVCDSQGHLDEGTPLDIIELYIK